jgi:arginine-tRNA-protein transferase
MFEENLQFLDDLTLINEEFYTAQVSKRQIDLLLADGWRHFGIHFFRYSFGFYKNDIRQVIPLRIRLSDFSHSKSQRRIINKNKDLQTIIRPIEITEEKENLFERHKKRFERGTPYSIFDFLSSDAANVPCKSFEACVYQGEKLIAASFFDVGEQSVSSIYAMFEPDESKRSLGIFTMLLEIDFALQNGKTFYYQGYAYEGESFYDYKKRFNALERFNWQGGWVNF